VLRELATTNTELSKQTGSSNNIAENNNDALLGPAIPLALAANKNGSTDEAAYDPLPPAGAVEHNRVVFPTVGALHQHPNVVEDNINNNNNNNEEEEEEDSDVATTIGGRGPPASAGHAADIFVVPNVVDENNNNNNNNNNYNNEEEE
jgi:hypothetical protein